MTQSGIYWRFFFLEEPTKIIDDIVVMSQSVYFIKSLLCYKLFTARVPFLVLIMVLLKQFLLS